MHTLSAFPSPSRHFRRLAILAALTAAASAHAGGGVYWSVNVDLPVAPMGRVVTAMSNAPEPVVVYRSEPVYVQQEPVYVQQQPVCPPPQRAYGHQSVYVQAPPVYVQSQPVYPGPARVVYAPQPVWWGHDRHHHEAWEGHEGHEGRWDRWDGGERHMIVPREELRGEWHGNGRIEARGDVRNEPRGDRGERGDGRGDSRDDGQHGGYRHH